MRSRPARAEDRGRGASYRLLLGTIAATLVLYNVSFLRPLAYPLVLLSTYAHELGHGISAILVGGQLEALQIAADASGLALLRVPEGRIVRAAVSAGGLVGPALLGAVFFALARRARRARFGLFVFGLSSLLVLLVWVRSLVGVVFVSTFGAACVLIAWKGSRKLARWVLVFLAVQLSLSVYARSDYLFTKTAGTGPSDVAQIAEALFLPYWFWGAVCAAISVLVLTAGVRLFVAAAGDV